MEEGSTTIFQQQQQQLQQQQQQPDLLGDDHHDGSTNSEGGGSSSGGGGGCFFADATLDLDEAHDIAETPEPPRRFLVMNHDKQNELSMPQLGSPSDSNDNNAAIDAFNDDLHNNNNGNNGNNGSLQAQQQQNQHQQHNAPKGSSMTRITSSDAVNNSMGNGNISGGGASNYTIFRAQPRWPRDLPWAIAFAVLVPVSLLWPLFHNHVSGGGTAPSWSLSKVGFLCKASFYSVLVAYLSTIALARALYRTIPGSDGDEMRHLISQMLLNMAPIAVFNNVALIGAIYLLIPRALPVCIIPAWYIVRDVVLYRRWKKRYSSNTTNYVNTNSRNAFFQALVCMALDILNRSLRRVVWYRTILLVLLLQFFVVMLWRAAILAALNINNKFIIIMAVLGGKWATGTVTRLLSLIASGGIASWFVQHSNMMEEMEQVAKQRQEDGEEPEEEEQSKIPEAYRSVEASVYRTVLDIEDYENSLDDDFDDDDIAMMGDDDNEDDDFALEAPSRNVGIGLSTGSSSRRGHRRRGGFAGLAGNVAAYFSQLLNPRRRRRRRQRHGLGSTSTSSAPYSASNHSNNPNTTVKSFLVSGLTISFGSVAKCGMLGGLAQFVWCQLRKVDEARTVISKFPMIRIGRGQQDNGVGNNRGESSLSPTGGGGGMNPISGNFQGMQIGADNDGDNTNNCNMIANRALDSAVYVCRDFVRGHSDLAMCHVAAYYKSYHRAARDVSVLVDESGVEPIIHDDITTHMCACVGGSLSSLVVIVAAYAATHYYHNHKTKLLAQAVGDWTIAENMILTYVLCYVIIFTIMEPLRASIKAVYVCFAQHPRSLRQTYPLIYQRLSRISESNMS